MIEPRGVRRWHGSVAYFCGKIFLAGAAVLKYTIEEHDKVGIDGEGGDQS